MNIIEFAKSLNLSIGTVSRALNDRPEVSAKTRERVLRKAREVGFVPNANARRLVLGRNYLLRLACPDNLSVLSDQYLVQIARAVEKAAAQNGYDLLFRLSSDHQPRLDLDRNTIDGQVLVVAADATAEHIAELTGNGAMPTAVICGPGLPDFEGGNCAFVSVNTLVGVEEAVSLLVEYGHRRIGFIGTDETGRAVSDHFPEIVRRHGLSWSDDLAIEAGFSSTGGAEAAIRLLQLPSPPTAIVTRVDMLAVGAIHGAYSLGLKVPEDVSIIGHDDVEIASLTFPPLTTVRIDTESVGHRAVTALLDMLDRQMDPCVVMVNAHIVRRGSAGPAPQAPPFPPLRSGEGVGG